MTEPSATPGKNSGCGILVGHAVWHCYAVVVIVSLPPKSLERLRVVLYAICALCVAREGLAVELLFKRCLVDSSVQLGMSGFLCLSWRCQASVAFSV